MFAHHEIRTKTQKKVCEVNQNKNNSPKKDKIQNIKFYAIKL